MSFGPSADYSQYMEVGNFIKFYCSLRDVVRWLCGGGQQ